MKLLLVTALLAIGALSGCTHVISEQSRRLVEPGLQFDKLRQNPDAYVGRHVMLGGIIAGVRNGQEGGQLEVVQFGLDNIGFPESYAGSGGRFIAVTPAFIDEYVYRRGRMVTIVGEVRGKKVLPVDEVSYLYPVISMGEAYLWKESYPEKQFPYPPPPPFYDPYYWGPWPGQQWFRPQGPPLREHR